MSRVIIPTLLARLGLSRYESSFLENGITEDLLPSLGHEELKELGVAGLGDRMQILAAVARLVPANALGPLVDRWPSVLAIPLQEYLAEENPVLKLWLACDVVEMLLRFIVMAGVAEARTVGGLPDNLVRQLRDRIEHPTLGKWQGMARAVVREVEPGRAVVPELRSYLEKVLVPLLDGTVAPATAETSFSRLRNTLAHGGGLTKSVARRLLGIWRGRFEEAVEKGAFLGELSLRVRDASGEWGELRGATTVPVAVDAEPGLPPSQDAESRGGLSLVRAGRILDLWPLAWYGEPLADDLSRTGFGDSPQVFVRRGEVRLEYTPVGSTGAARSVGEDGTLSAFLRFFLPEDRVTRAETKDFVVRGFDGDFRKDADRLVGRAREVEALREAVDAANRSVIWVSGHAGVGKSYVVAKLATHLLDEAPAGTLVLPYRFRAGDDRCGRDPFVRYCVERLEAWPGGRWRFVQRD
ncbi:hypothetical protein EG835_07460, partial [bacterium]|nr:hypothetical protein [bacterium]